MTTIKSSLASKINWTQVVAAGAILATMFGFELTPEQQAAIVAVIALIGQVVTAIARTWFTTSITEASAKVAGITSPNDRRTT